MKNLEGSWSQKGTIYTLNKINSRITSVEDEGTAVFTKLAEPFYQVVIYGPGYTLKSVFMENNDQLVGSFYTNDESIFYLSKKCHLREKFTSITPTGDNRYGDLKFCKIN